MTAALENAGVVQLTETTANEAYERDDARSAPHNLFVSTKSALPGRQADRGGHLAPARALPIRRRRAVAEQAAHVGDGVVLRLELAEWAWSGGRWVRQLDGAPMLAENGAPIAVDNVVIQEVVVTMSDIVDAAGNPSPEVELLGEGRAWILRDGRLVIGRWRRASLGDVTVFETKAGEEIALAPGTTFVELMPKDDAGATFER